MIGGNVYAEIQAKNTGVKNQIGEVVHDWVGCMTLKGFLDLISGDSFHTNLNAKIQESTHVFICDYASLECLAVGWQWDTIDLTNGKLINPDTSTVVDITSENARMVIMGNEYQIQLIDDPMGLHDHIEFYLKFIGGGLGA